MFRKRNILRAVAELVDLLPMFAQGPERGCGLDQGAPELQSNLASWPLDGARCRLMADSVEKVLAAVGTKFLRAADAFNAV